MLEITKTSDKIHKNLSALIYGKSGAGKTSLAKTLPIKDDSRVLIISVDPGHLALKDRNFNVAVPQTWAEVKWLIQDHLKGHKDEYDWVVLDGLDEMGEMSVQHELTLTTHGIKAYGEMATKMKALVKYVRDLGPNTLFITHEDQQLDSDTPYAPRFPGKSLAAQLVDMFDQVMCLRILNSPDGKGTVRMIQTKPDRDPRYMTKDRSGALEPFEEPNMAAIFDKIHGEE